MVEDVAAGVVVAVLLLAMFVVAEVGVASPVVAAMAAEEEASVADLVVMVVVHLHMEAELHPTAAEEDMAEAMVTQAAPRMVHPPGGKSVMPIQHHSMHREHLFPSHLIRELYDSACTYDRRMLQTGCRQFPLADTTRHHYCNFSFSAQHDNNDR